MRRLAHECLTQERVTDAEYAELEAMFAHGVTLRDRFAMAATEHAVEREVWRVRPKSIDGQTAMVTSDEECDAAYRIADRMLEARKK